MRAIVPPKQRVHRILKGSNCFLSPALCVERSLQQDVFLSPGEEFLGAIWGSRLESILTDRGAFFRVGSSWRFVAYGDVEDITFPTKSDPDGSLTLRTSIGSIDLLRGSPELWEVGRFFMRCAADAKRV